MFYRRVPLPGAPGDFSKHKLRGGVAGIDLEFFFQLILRACGSLRAFRFRKVNPPKAVMNPRQLRILLQDAVLFAGLLVPFSLGLLGLCFEFVSLARTEGLGEKVLRRLRSE